MEIYNAFKLIIIYNFRIWVHEVLRVFFDRLVETGDRTWLCEKLQHNVEEYFSEAFEDCLDTLPKENGRVRYIVYARLNIDIFLALLIYSVI